VIGSIDFAQTLLNEQLYDELQLWVYPIVLGQGKKVFPDGATPHNMKLVHAESGDGGTLLLRYAPLPGEPATGTM
jgi:dihydrofolate reductase